MRRFDERARRAGPAGGSGSEIGLDSQMTSTNEGAVVRPIADVVGLTGSVLCALHCLIVPITLVFGQVGPLALVEDEFFHRVLLVVVVPSAVLAFLIGCRQHRDRAVLILGSLGLILLTAALTILHDPLGENGERVAAILASGSLIAAHVRNFRLCRRDACEHETPVAGGC